jgi:hypothetical protein
MSRSYPLYVVRQHARRPPFRLVRGSVGDQSADIRARGAFERACRTATPTSCFARGGAACRLLLRFAASESSTASSQLAALPRSPWLQPARSRPPLASIHFEKLDRTLVLPPRALLDRVCRAVPRACNGQAVFSSIEALACSTPTNGCGARRKDECESREENLRGRPTTQGPSWQQDRREGWRVHAPTITNA